MLSQVVAVLGLGTPMPEPLYFPRPMMIICDKLMAHHLAHLEGNSTPKGTPAQMCWETKPNLHKLAAS